MRWRWILLMLALALFTSACASTPVTEVTRTPPALTPTPSVTPTKTKWPTWTPPATHALSAQTPTARPTVDPSPLPTSTITPTPTAVVLPHGWTYFPQKQVSEYPDWFSVEDVPEECNNLILANNDNSYICAVRETQDSQGTEQSHYCCYDETGLIVKETFNEGSCQGVLRVDMDEDKQFWATTINYQICRYDDDEWRVIHEYDQTVQKIHFGWYRLLADSSNRVWGYAANEIFLLTDSEGKTWTVEDITTQHEYNTPPPFCSDVQLKDFGVEIGTWAILKCGAQGIARYDNGQWTSYTLTLPEDYWNLKFFTSENAKLYVLVVHSGYAVYDDDELSWHEFAPELKALNLNSIAATTSGEIWFSSWKDDVIVMRDDETIHLTASNGLPFPDLQYIDVKNGTDVWFVYEHGIVVYAPEDAQ